MCYGGSCLPPLCKWVFSHKCAEVMYRSSWGLLEDPASQLWLPGAPSDIPGCHSNVAIFYMCHDLQNFGKDLSRYAHACTQYTCQQRAAEKHLPWRAGLFPPFQLLLTTSPLFPSPTDIVICPAPCHNAIYTSLRKEKLESFS